MPSLALCMPSLALCYAMESGVRRLTPYSSGGAPSRRNDYASWSFSTCFYHSRAKELELHRVILQHLHFELSTAYPFTVLGIDSATNALVLYDSLPEWGVADFQSSLQV
jgi:hypothetical protein